MNGLGKIKLRLGDLWWYTLVMFVVQRVGDVINAFIGLWLVPKYVPQEELGALLPLSQVGVVLALPLSVMAVTFSKFVNKFATRGEYGKVKSLVRDVFVLVAIIFVVAIFYAQFAMPLVFERMRVADGRLGMLVVASGILSVAATFFTNALQALKKFKLVTLIGFFGAPLRLVTLLICLPIRALSGYFAGQIVPTLYGICASVVGLKEVLFSKRFKALPYLRQEGRGMLRFSAVIFVGSVFGGTQGLVEAFVIRHRLPEIESAAYYMISRFSEMGTYVGVSMMFVLFPLASEQYENKDHSQKLILSSMAGAFLSGVPLAFAFWLFGKQLLECVPSWHIYVDFVPHMALLTIIFAMRASTNCFISHEIAQHRFHFYWYTATVGIVESVFLYGITGFSFFSPWVPSSWIHFVNSMNPSRLGFVLAVMLCASLVVLFCMGVQLVLQRRLLLRQCI